MSRSNEMLAKRTTAINADQFNTVDVRETTNREVAKIISAAFDGSIKTGEAEIEDQAVTLRQKHRGDGLWIGGANNWTDPFTMQAVIEVVQPDANDVIYDLGAGYNFPSLYTAMVTPARCRGVELLPERAKRSQEAQAKLEEAGLLEAGRVMCIEASAYDVGVSDGTIFYTYNSFGGEGLTRVLSKVDEVAADHHVSLVTRRMHHERITDRVANLTLVGAIDYRPSIEGVVYVFGSK